MLGREQGSGYATEAVEWLLPRAFIGHGLNRVESEWDPTPRVFLIKEAATDRVISVRQLLELEHLRPPSLRKSVSPGVLSANRLGPSALLHSINSCFLRYRGFVVEGIRREAVWQEGAYRDDCMMYVQTMLF